jgi:hypothetical protein
MGLFFLSKNGHTGIESFCLGERMREIMMGFDPILRVIMRITAVILYLIFAYCWWRFGKELRKEKMNGQRLSRTFVKKWGRLLSINIFIMIFATILSLLLILTR